MYPFLAFVSRLVDWIAAAISLLRPRKARP